MPINAKDPRGLQLVDAVLTQIARAHKPTGFVAEQLLSTIPVTLDSGKYPVFDGFFDDDVDPKVADRAETPEVDFQLSEDSYFCEDYRLKASLTDKEERNAHSVVRLRQNKLDVVLTRMAIRRERRAADMLRHTANGGQLTGNHFAAANKWNLATATIEQDIKTSALAVYKKTGMSTNTIVIPYEVAYEVALQEDIREIIKYTVPGDRILIDGERILPRVLHGHRVLVPKGAMRNTAKEGAAKNLEDIWGDNVRLIYTPEGGGGWGIPATGYTFRARPQVVDRWRENDPPVEYVRAWECADEKVAAPDLGAEISDVL